MPLDWKRYGTGCPAEAESKARLASSSASRFLLSVNRTDQFVLGDLEFGTAYRVFCFQKSGFDPRLFGRRHRPWLSQSLVQLVRGHSGFEQGCIPAG